MRSDCIVLPLFENTLPTRGLLGMLDWRLCGTLSHWAAEHVLDFSPGQRTLIPLRPHINADALLLVGMGAVDHFDAELYQHTSALIWDTLEQCSWRSFACVLPGRSTEACIDVQSAVDTWVHHTPVTNTQHQCVIFEDSAQHAEAEAAVERFRRKLRAMASL